MNREILFCGKRIDTGEWVQGYLFQIWERTYILWGTTNNVPNMIEVDLSTVGQFTGLTNKNGKKIFEGDICKDSLGWVFTVAWDKDARFLGRSPDDRIAYVSRVQKVEVIGNIHDGKDRLHD